MKKLIQYFVDRSFVVNLVMGFICLAGVFALTSMKRDLMPPLEWQMIRVDVSLPGATPSEIEKFLTYPIEEAVGGMAGVERLTSSSKNGQVTFRLFYDINYDRMNEAVELVRSRIDSLRGRLPDGIRYINVRQARIDDVFLFFLGIENFDDTNELHRQFYKRFEKRVSEVPGVVRFWNSLSSQDVYVEMNLDKLQSYEITVSQVRQTLSQGLRFAPIGEAKVGDKRYAVEIATSSNSIESIKNLPIRSNRTGNTVYIKDVATVGMKLADKLEMQYINGLPGVIVNIKKDMISDSIDLKPKVTKIIDEFNAIAPAGVKIVSLIDGPHFIEKQLDVLTQNGLIGFLLVLLILMLFLNWRTAIMTSLGLPVAYCGTMIILLQMGFRIDLLSIIGLILVIGVLVDDAIIVSEKYIDNLTRGLTPRASAVEAVRELLVPVTGTVLTTIVAFSPLLLIRSEIGNVLYAVPVVVISALFLSWLESFFILPNHLAHFVKTPPSDKKVNLFRKVQSGYERLLFQTLRFRYLAFFTVMALLGLAGYVAATKLKHNFDLDIQPEAIRIYAFLKESESLQDTLDKIKPIEQHLLDFPKEELENVFTSVGWVWADGRVYEGQKFVKINAYVNRNHKYPSKLKEKVTQMIKAKLKSVDRQAFQRLDVGIDRFGNDEKKKGMVTVRVEGHERVSYLEIFDKLKKISQELPAIDTLIKEPNLMQQSWVFVPDPKSVASYNFSLFDVAQQARSYFTPHEIIETRFNGENTWVYSEVAGRRNLKFKELSAIEIVTPAGTSVPLKFLGRWKSTESLTEIQHRNGRRVFNFDFKWNDEAGNAMVAKEQLSKAVAVLQEENPDYSIKVVDTDENEAKSQAWALKVAVVCIIAVLMVLALILGSLTQPLIVGMPIPFGLIGIVFALYFHGMPLGLMALVGLVGTVGVAVNASIVMCDQINRLHRLKGFMSREVLVEGASSRLRAILLTTLTTLGGVFPMAYSFGGESGFTQPLAFSIAWGLTFATILTLFILPAFLEIREDLLSLWGRYVLRQKPAQITVPSESSPIPQAPNPASQPHI